MNVLAFSDRDVEKLKSYALANVYDLRKEIPAGDIPEHVLTSGGNIRVVYSVEDQPNIGLCQHVSISKVGDELPSPDVVAAVLEIFGYRLGEYKKFYVEEGVAVNVIQKIERAE